MPPGLQTFRVPAWIPGERIGAEIYTIWPDGKGLSQITRNGYADRAPAWSPDGTKIAFSSDRDGHDFEIYVRDLRTGQVTQLTDNTVNPDYLNDPIDERDPAWSPDGAEIGFLSDRDSDWSREFFGISIYAVDATDGSDERLISPIKETQGWLDWSPDGTKIAYTAGPEGLIDLWVGDADGSDPKNLTSTPTNFPIERAPDWSPHGRKIVYKANEDDDPAAGDVWRISPDGSGKQRLLGSALAKDADPVWSPSG